MQGPFWVPYNTETTVQFTLYDSSASALTTGASFASGDVVLVADQGTPANSTNLPTHEGNGVYSLTLTAAETSADQITVVVDDQTATELWFGTSLQVFTYGAANGWITAFPANAVQISGSAAASDNLESFYSIGAVTFTVQASPSPTVSSCGTNLTEVTDDHYRGKALYWLTGNLAGQVSWVQSYDGTLKTITFAECTEAPANTDTAIII